MSHYRIKHKLELDREENLNIFYRTWDKTNKRCLI